jgi:hypothetical protein
MFFRIKQLPNVSINKKPIFFSEVVIYKTLQRPRVSIKFEGIITATVEPQDLKGR